MKRTFALKARFLVAVLLALGCAALAAESFRVTRAHTASIDPDRLEAVTVYMGYNDGIAIVLPDDMTFIKAVEIEVKSTESIARFQGAMAYSLYTGLSRLPDGNAIDFSGNRLSMEILPSKLTFALQVPLREGHGLKSDPYTDVLAQVPKPESLPLFFRLFPIMKGLPDEFEEAVFTVRVKPVLIDEGGLLLSVAYPAQDESASLNVRIDEKPVREPEKMLLLLPGEHHLAVSASRCRTEVRTFIIERAKVSRLTVELKDSRPTVSFASPDNVIVAIDGRRVDNPRAALTIAPGRHTVTFSVGDYSLQRQFTAEEGRDYTVSMTLDAEVVEIR